ncbi:RNA polymerase sigma factor [Knoellia aerolata]|uniref:RNA polymerase subunit sigma-24 n=1 Tax=Knoellia aerolata DSM 18566 TaxID=1385519 RepID=A0A0A0K4B8_9MICO|nr:sigma-70 family RNA polymerase sigma factor [Knoellia aerolata]KGN42661.1 RNA polymerase subunit sigma-24 [Knoellia aerolata DSM 18566]
MGSEDTSPVLGADAVATVVRAEYGRVVAGLIRRFGDIQLAEDALGEAIVIALERWPRDGVPPNPAGWLTTTASRKALDHLRRERVRDEKYAEAAMLTDDTPPEPTGPVKDDRLRLIFTCCHPALAEPARVALTLRLLGGLTVAEIASAFLVPETTMAQRITRAKAKIATARIPYRVPGPDDVADRLDAVLAVLYLVHNEGYLSRGGESADREDLALEAIRLTRALRSLAGDIGSPPEVDGLLALMLLSQARRPARIDDAGRLVTLDEQDRARWDTGLIDEGHALVRECLRRGAPGPYQIQAAIQAVHTDARDVSLTDWGQVVALYDQLLRLRPSPVVALNRAVALAELDGPQVALAVVDELELTAYAPWHATRADLLRRLGRDDDAGRAYAAAIATTPNPAERAWLASRRDRLGHGWGEGPGTP